MRDWYLTNRDRSRAQQKEYRERNHEQVLEGKHRYREANLEKVRAADAAWKAANLQQRVAYTAQWRKDNPDARKREYQNNAEVIKQRAKDFYQQNRAECIARAAQWRKDHPEEAAAQRRREYENNAELFKQRAKEWLKANPDRAKVSGQRRRAIRKGAPGHFTRADLLLQFEKQQGKCFYCQKPLQNMGTVDHYIPISKGGTNYPDNIVLACWPCNTRKGAKLPTHFRA